MNNSSGNGTKVFRIYVEKRVGFDVGIRSLRKDFEKLLGVTAEDAREFLRYDVQNIAEKDFMQDTLDNIAALTLADFDEEFSLLREFCGKPFEEHFRFYLSDLIQQCQVIEE